MLFLLNFFEMDEIQYPSLSFNMETTMGIAVKPIHVGDLLVETKEGLIVLFTGSEERSDV